MKKYREGIRLRIQLYSLSLTIVEASRTTIVENADLSQGPVRTGIVFATSMYFSRAIC
jgi:hypothetical protein